MTTAPAPSPRRRGRPPVDHTDTADRADLLAAAGHALYGQHAWQSELARAIGLSSPRRLREYVAAERRAPDRVLAAALDLVRTRGEGLAEIAWRIGQALADKR